MKNFVLFEQQQTIDAIDLLYSFMECSHIFVFIGAESNHRLALSLTN